jgi:hypothetical protein
MSAAVVIPVPVLVGRAIDRLHSQRLAAFRLPHETTAQNADRSRAIAGLFALEERWWQVLSRHAYVPDVPRVFAHAVMDAAAKARSDARFWAEAACYWQARNAGHSHDDAEHLARSAA